MNRYYAELLRTAVVLIVLLSVVAFGLSCGEPDVPYIVDQDEIRRYLATTEAGRELFRVNGLINNDSYVLDFDPDAIYQDVLDSTRRSLDFDMIDSKHYDTLKQDFGSPIGWARDAEVTVQDRLYVTTTRIEGSATTTIQRERTVTRYAYFLKLGSDARDYAGWLLHGYNGNTPFAPAGLLIEKADHTTFPGDGRALEYFTSLIINTAYQPWDTVGTRNTQYGYVKLEDIENINEGETLVAISDGVPSRSAYQTLSAESGAGFYSIPMSRPDASTYVDTVLTPDPNNRLWNILFFEEFRWPQADPGGEPDLTQLSVRSWAVPYRVAQ